MKPRGCQFLLPWRFGNGLKFGLSQDVVQQEPYIKRRDATPRAKLNSSFEEGKDETSTSQNPLKLQVLTKEPPETALRVQPRSCAGMWWLHKLVQGQEGGPGATTSVPLENKLRAPALLSWAPHWRHTAPVISGTCGRMGSKVICLFF